MTREIVAAILIAAGPLAVQPADGQQSPGPSKEVEAKPSRRECPRPAPGYELRVYDVSALVSAAEDRPGPRIELRPSSASAAFTLEDPVTYIPVKSLVQLITTSFVSESWKDPRAYIEPEGDRLVIIQTPAVHGQIGRLLADLDTGAALRIAVEGTVALVDDALIESWRTGEAGSVTLSGLAAKALGEALRAGQQAVRLASLRVVARSGQRVHARALTQQAYLQDFDAETTCGPNPYKCPIPGYFLKGTVFDVRPAFCRGLVACEVRFTRMDGPIPVPTFDLGLPLWGPLGLPSGEVAILETTVAGMDGQTLLAGRVKVHGHAGRAEGLAPVRMESSSRSICYFIRPTIVRGSSTPQEPDDGDCPVRVFDTGPLTMPANDFAAPWLGLVPHGVFVSQDEEKNRMTVPLLREAIRGSAVPDSPDATAHTIVVGGHSLFIRQPPHALARIDNYLGNLIAQRCRMIHSRAVIVSAESAAYESLNAHSPALAAGSGIFSTDEAVAILGRAARGEGGLSIAATGEMAGLNGRRINIRCTRQETYVRDFDVESAPLLLVRSPQVDIAEDGFALDCRPALSADGKAVNVELRVWWARCDRPMPVARLNASGAQVHLPAMDVAPVVGTIVAKAGEPVLAGIAGPVKVGGMDRFLLTIVQFAPVELNRD